MLFWGLLFRLLLDVSRYSSWVHAIQVVAVLQTFYFVCPLPHFPDCGYFTVLLRGVLHESLLKRWLHIFPCSARFITLHVDQASSVLFPVEDQIGHMPGIGGAL